MAYHSTVGLVSLFHNMLKQVKTIRKERYKNPIKCPNCGRVLGDAVSVSGVADIVYLCSRCGNDVSVELKDMRGEMVFNRDS